MSAISDQMTRIEALKHLGEVFRTIGIETAQRDARLLMLDAAGIVHACPSPWSPKPSCRVLTAKPWSPQPLSP